MVRELEISELNKLNGIAGRFYDSSEFLDHFDIEVFKKSWTALLEAEVGVIFALVIDEEIHGVIGGVKYPDINSGALIATEFFWFVDEAHRGRGLHLLKKFEAWAKENDCEKIAMVHMVDLMPEAVKKIYERKGYKKMETHYIKEVV